MTLDPTAVITVTPGRNFGAPSVNGGPSADVVAGMVWAGDPVQSVADEYEISRAAVLVACWYVAMYRPGKRQWRKWRITACELLAVGTYDRIPDPPSKEDTR